MDFFDYTASSPKEELRLACQRTYADNLHTFGSLQGRSVCVIQVLKHAAGIVIKPLYYLAIAVLSYVTLRMVSSLTPEQVEQARREDPHNTIDASVFRNNPELVEEYMTATAKKWLFCAFVAPASQLIQLFKATLGILHPGIYFQNYELIEEMQALARTAEEVGCDANIVQSLGQGPVAIHNTLNLFSDKEYYYAQFKIYIRGICTAFANPHFPNERKFQLLTLLGTDFPENGSLEACAAGLGRILQQIYDSVQVPEHSKVIPWIEGRLKLEVLNQMVLQAESTRNDPAPSACHTSILNLAFEQLHRSCALAVAVGNEIGLSEAVIENARRDPMRGKSLSREEKEAILARFYQLYTEDALISCIMGEINSKADGSSGLVDFRNHVFQTLAAMHPEKEDPVEYAVSQYYLNGGHGNPSDEGFTNLNEKAIRAFLHA